MNRGTLSALLMVGFLVAVVFTVLVAFSKTCYDETLLANQLLQDFLEKHADSIATLQNTTAMTELWDNAEAGCSHAVHWVPLQISELVLTSPESELELFCVQHTADFKNNAQVWPYFNKHLFF